MTPEEKQLLLKDLCARLPYGVKVCARFNTGNRYTANITAFSAGGDYIQIRQNDLHPYTGSSVEDIRPYLRPMSSITEEEWLILKEWIFIASDTKGKIYFDGFRNISAEDTIKTIDYLISHLFDYRGLIEKGLALEAPEDMYKTA